MGLKCPHLGCDSHLPVDSYGASLSCENGHQLRLVEERTWRFLQRATQGVNA